jgi:dTDP-4-dehydrorhamnose reductase
MPHVVIKGTVTPEQVWDTFTPLSFSEAGNRYKFEDAYLSADRKTLILRSLSVERGYSKNFLMRLYEKEPGVLSIGLDKYFKPDVTEGLKRAIGLYAWSLLSADLGLELITTNLGELLGEPK